MESGTLETRLGPLAWQSSGTGPALVFFAGALANHDLWRDVVATLERRYHCITIDLPLGAHPWPLSEGADRSAISLAGRCSTASSCSRCKTPRSSPTTLRADCSCCRWTPVIVLSRIDRLVLTNCETYDKFPPDKLKKASAMCRRLPGLARGLMRLQGRSSTARRRGLATVTAHGLDRECEQSFFGPGRRDPRVIGDYVAFQGSCEPRTLTDAARAIPRFHQPVLLIWGDACEFFPIADAQRLASDLPDARLITVPGAKAWVPVDNPVAVADGIGEFVPTPVTSPPARGRARRCQPREPLASRIRSRISTHA